MRIYCAEIRISASKMVVANLPGDGGGEHSGDGGGELSRDGGGEPSRDVVANLPGMTL